MTAFKTVTINCDGNPKDLNPGEPFSIYSVSECPGWIESGSASIPATRAYAKRNGWTRDGVSDYCEAHTRLLSVGKDET